MEYHHLSQIILANHRIDHEYLHKSILIHNTSFHTVIGLLTSSIFPSSINISRSLSQTYFTSLSLINSQFRNYTSYTISFHRSWYQIINTHTLQLSNHYYSSYHSILIVYQNTIVSIDSHSVSFSIIISFPRFILISLFIILFLSSCPIPLILLKQISLRLLLLKSMMNDLLIRLQYHKYILFISFIL